MGPTCFEEEKNLWSKTGQLFAVQVLPGPVISVFDEVGPTNIARTNVGWTNVHLTVVYC